MEIERNTVDSVFVRYDGKRDIFSQDHNRKRYFFSRENRFGKIPLKLFNICSKRFPGYLTVVTEDAYNNGVKNQGKINKAAMEKRVQIIRDIEKLKINEKRETMIESENKKEELRSKLGLRPKRKPKTFPPSRGKVGLNDGLGNKASGKNK
jgi:hypothetical protein